MRLQVLAALVLAGCASNHAIRLTGATPEETEQAIEALAQLRHDTAGLIDDHLADDGEHSVNVVSYACDVPGCPDVTDGRARGGNVWIYPEGQRCRFAYTFVHELLHTHGLMHVGPGLAVMADANDRSLDVPLQSTCLHVEDQRELCRVFGCKASALPPACEGE